MPKREDITSVMIIGSGPIVIGQAGEFDYSGTQAVKSLKEEGYRVILVNSNPASIMTDQNLADKIYIEPLSLPYLTKIIEKERPDTILPTVGGQVALNCALELHDAGILHKYAVELIGANVETIRKAEDRKLFKEAMHKISVSTPESGFAHNWEEAKLLLDKIHLPVILRPSYTLGGSGGGICFSQDKFKSMVLYALEISPTNQVLIEKSILGWKEFELELMRDQVDNVVIICSIENVDPVGIHTGDSITVAPQQTLSDIEYHNLRDLSIKIMREIGVETGGANIQFAVNPENGDVVVIEMNPRVSRSSALASKATGFAIAKIAAKLSVGYTLPELVNEITKQTPACFEPSLDYIVTKMPRFNFDKFPHTDPTLGSQMRSVGEVMAIGRTFAESFQKAIRSLEIDHDGWGADTFMHLPLKVKNYLLSGDDERAIWNELLGKPTHERIFVLHQAFLHGLSVDDVYQITKIDRWFLEKLYELIILEKQWQKEFYDTKKLSYSSMKKSKELGYADKQLALVCLHPEYDKLLNILVRMEAGSKSYIQLYTKFQKKVSNLAIKIAGQRDTYQLLPVIKSVDTCAAEFQATTSYLYTTYEQECESHITSNKKIIILGSGPNRIGQGIEFDYCCCHASFALKSMGIESIMVNCNPETVSTDYDTSNKLYFEPLHTEHILDIYHKENRDGNVLGVIIQFGGQTPLRIGKELEKHGVTILGTTMKTIHQTEDRHEFSLLMNKLKLAQPMGQTAWNLTMALKVAKRIGYPLLARPSYVLGGSAMSILYSDAELKEYLSGLTTISKDRPILIDQFIEDAIEIDVDAVCDGKQVIIAGIMEHIEEAGVHSGDSACTLPTVNIAEKVLAMIHDYTTLIALQLCIKGCLNIQFALKEDKIYILEVNPRASRTVPFVSKAIRQPIAQIATRIMLGYTLEEQDVQLPKVLTLCNIKEAVLPFDKFVNTDIILGPEMQSTGEVMGIGKTFVEAFIKAQESAGHNLPKSGTIFISINDTSKPHLVSMVKGIVQKNYTIVATLGTSKYLQKHGIPVNTINKLHEGQPNIIDAIQNKEIHFILNIPTDHATRNDALEIRLSAISYRIPYATTLAAARFAFLGMMSLTDEVQVYDLSHAP